MRLIAGKAGWTIWLGTEVKIPYDFQTYQSPEGPGPPQETERRGRRKRTRECLTDLKGRLPGRSAGGGANQSKREKSQEGREEIKVTPPFQGIHLCK